MKHSDGKLSNGILFFLIIFGVLGCDGLIRGEEKILLREKSGLLREYQGECLVYLYSNYDSVNRILIHKTGSQVKNGNLIYLFTVSPKRISYQMEIKCEGGIYSQKILSFPEDSNLDFHKNLFIHESK